MQVYNSMTYESFSIGQYSRNTFFILSDEERFKLADKIKELEYLIAEKIEEERLIPLYTKAGTLKKTGGSRNNIVGKDLEAIDFLKRICHFTEYKDSVMLDPTAHQLETIVDKLLQKVVYKSFIDWMQLWVDKDKLEPRDMREWMNRKRDLARSLKDEGLLNESFSLPY